MNVLEINKEALRSLVEPLVEQIARDKAPNIVAQRYVNTKDAAKYLGVSFPTFKKWVEEKNVYPVVIAGAKRWDKQDLDNELEREKRK
ncbi:helix-turn-helix domain-containing protein [Lactobacillus delbrueckii]|uniref:helix-turn-helix domain-containing protein n=1 Tax=Lactobacillus delbrueckii TaxID=1584 RepID=UPI001E489D4D|nr:helix-turn-helix domain-containing protein [Lactobacillus delbrueckii]